MYTRNEIVYLVIVFFGLFCLTIILWNYLPSTFSFFSMTPALNPVFFAYEKKDVESLQEDKIQSMSLFNRHNLAIPAGFFILIGVLSLIEGNPAMQVDMLITLLPVWFFSSIIPRYLYKNNYMTVRNEMDQ